VISLPDHGCCAGDPRLAGAEAYGDLDARNVATCSLRRRWGVRDGNAPGCGARLALCHGCGLRTRVLRPGELEAPPCEVCGGTARPPQGVLTADPARASSADVDPTRSIVEPKAPVDTAASRVEKGRPAAKPRTVAKRARKVAASEGPMLPGVK
jgi:hypothetical protein